MDVTKRYTIAYKGLSDGIHDFGFKVGDGLFEAYENSEIKGGDCDVHIRLNRSERMLELDAAIDGTVVVACDRCLEDCAVPVHFEGHLIVKFSDEVDDYDGEVMWISPSAGEVDLAQYIYESIVLSLPYQRVHPEGKCDPEMLKRFHIVSDSEFAAIEASAGAEAAEEQQAVRGEEWGKLEALREQMTRDIGQKVRNDNKKEKK